MRRPYYDYKNDELYYDDNLYSKIFRIKFINESRVINKLLFTYEKFLKNYFIKDIKNIDNLIIESEKVTLNLLRKMSTLFNDTPKYLFNCSNKSIIHNRNWKKIALLADFKILEDSSNLTEESIKYKKKIFYIDGGHLNILGNDILGNNIFNEIKKDLLIN